MEILYPPFLYIWLNFIFHISFQIPQLLRDKCNITMAITMSFYDSVLLISHFLKEFPQIPPLSRMPPSTSSLMFVDLPFHTTCYLSLSSSLDLLHGPVSSMAAVTRSIKGPTKNSNAIRVVVLAKGTTISASTKKVGASRREACSCLFSRQSEGASWLLRPSGCLPHSTKAPELHTTTQATKLGWLELWLP